MNKYIEEMLKQGIIVGGKIINKEGFIIFKRLPFEELVKLNEQDLAYATQSMGRAIFIIDSDDKIININGVDSQLDNTELAFTRLGIYELPEFLEFAKRLNMTIEDFVKTVDRSYSLGQRYGQAQRLVESPFRISDLEYYVKTGDINAINNITAFTEQSLNINDRFEIDYANEMGKNIAMLMNNGWVCENLANRQDFTLAGEMCDDAYYDLKAHVMEINENTNFSTGKKKALKSDIMKDYFAQVFHISSTIKVLQDEMGLRKIDKQEINLVLETFVNSFTTNLDLNKISEILETDTEKLKEVFKVLLGKPSDYR